MGVGESCFFDMIITMGNDNRVTVIIPVVKINDFICEAMPKILEVDWADLEVLIFPDREDRKHNWPKTRIIASGKVGPAEKRDMAIKYASGAILAFLDDDAYPEKDWLKKACRHFKDKKVAAVGGPAITPVSNGVLQKVSGAVYESFLGGGSARNRYLSVGRVTKTEDWPTVNLLILKDVFEKIGGFDSAYWPGEDTKLCLDVIKSGYKIIYEPKAVVYHHRRADLWKHLKQVGNYALHRGYFAKIYPETSRKVFYFVPSLFDFYLVCLGLVLIMRRELVIMGAVPLGLYLALLLIDGVVISFRWKNVLVGLITMPMILFTHIWYGVKFVQGLLTRQLVSELRK